MPSEMECEMGSLSGARARIFVSAAESDRAFAERLCADMERAGLSPFLNRKSNAALAVVVVSEEYLTRSSTAELELQGLCEVLPLFWGLSREESRQRGLGDEGVEYVKAFGEARYRQEVVAAVCRKLGIDVAERDGGTRPKGCWYYLRLVLVVPAMVVSVICVGSILYSAFFCDQGYPSPYGIIIPTIT